MNQNELSIQKEEIKSDLKEMFANVNHWLEFAEAKHAGLIAFNIALFAVFMDWGLFCVWKFLISCTIIVSIVLSLLAFLSGTKIIFKIAELKGFGEKKDTDNLLYYGHIVKYQNEEYREAVKKKYFDNIQMNKIMLDYLDEIWVNARITLCKYILFVMALLTDIFVLIIFIVFMIWG